MSVLPGAGPWDVGEYPTDCHRCGALSYKDVCTLVVYFFVAMCVPFLNIHGFLFAFRNKKGREKIMQVYATFWALLPPIIAIVLALITMEV